MINSIVIILVLILFLELSGYLVVKKLNLKTRYSIVFGFLLIVAFFEVVSFPFIIFQTTFTLYRYVVWILLLGFYIILFKCSKFNKSILKEWLNTFDKQKCLVYFIGTMVGFYIAIVSINAFDSWLYLPMVLNPIQNNNMVYNPLHIFDGYYKFLSFITYYTGNDVEVNYIFLMSFYKFFEIVILINFFGFIAEQVFKKEEKIAFSLLCIGLIWQIDLLLPSSGDFELILEIYKVSPNGTIFLEGLIIPFLFIYLYKSYKSNKLLLLILLAGLGLSSSMIYIYAFFLVIYVGYEIFVNKKYLIRDYIVRAMMLLIPIYVLLEYFIVKKVGITSNEVIVKASIIFIIVFVFIGLVMYLLFKLTKEDKKDKRIFKLSLGMYFLVIVISMIVGIVLSQGNLIIKILPRLFDITLRSSQYSGSINYNTYLNNGIYTIMYILGLYMVFKKERKLFILHIAIVGLAANYIIYQTLGFVISQNVYHRVFIFSSYYIFVIMGVIFIRDKIFKKEYGVKGFIINKRKYGYIIVYFVLLINLANVKIKEFYKFNESFIEYKVDNIDVLQFMDFDFKSKYIKGVEAPSGLQTTNQLLQLNTDLVAVDVCSHDCYLMKNKNTSDNTINTNIEESRVVYETTNYVLEYME